MEECLFCRIIKGEVESEKVGESDHSFAFRDINPKAPTHVLIVPKKHHLKPNEVPSVELADLFKLASEVAEKEGVKTTGYRLTFNVGANAGQVIDHVHLHLMGGKRLNFEYT